MERAFVTPLELPIGGAIGVLAGEHYSIRTGDLLITKSYLVTSKDDGLAIAMGAFMGARNPVTIMKLLGWGFAAWFFPFLRTVTDCNPHLVRRSFSLEKFRDSHLAPGV